MEGFSSNQLFSKNVNFTKKIWEWISAIYTLLCFNKIPNYFFRNNQQTYKDTLLKQFKHLQPQDPSTNLQTTTKLKLLLLLLVVHVITNKTMKFKLEPRWKMLLWALKNKKKSIFFLNNETSWFFSIKTHLTVVLYYFPLFHGHSRSV